MRRIKFRVYNKKTKSWLHGPHKDNSLDGCNILGEMILFGEFLNGVSIEDLNEIEVLQYTGLKDNSGKDIFEGDILLVGTHEDWGAKEKDYYNKVVKYETRPSGETELSGFLFIPKDRQIIGNIFDNPELAK